MNLQAAVGGRLLKLVKEGKNVGVDPPSAAVEDIHVVACPTFTHDGGRSTSSRVREMRMLETPRPQTLLA